MKQALFLSLTLLGLLLGNACTTADDSQSEKPEVLAPLSAGEAAQQPGTFAYDFAFLKQYQEVFVLQRGEAQLIVNPAYQGRVMTSTAQGMGGQSFGWLNYELISSGKYGEQISAFGGEDRFWLGPEGGQFSFYFPPGSDFSFENWKVPKELDQEPFEVVSETETEIHFARNFALTNYQGNQFEMKIRRSIRLLEEKALFQKLGVAPVPGLKSVAFESENLLTNIGETAWTKSTGTPSMWILGMLKPSPQTTIILPYRSGSEADLGPVVNDAYFGKVPAQRLRVGEKAVFLSGDGKYRSKIGLSAKRALPVAGSWDAQSGVLTIIQFSQNPRQTDYVNSLWEQQKKPFAGDVVNAYNDGPLEGSDQLGPFYELESSSPAAALIPGQTMIHMHTTFHLVGEKAALDRIAQAVLGVSLAEAEG
jgi:hypothetical protein